MKKTKEVISRQCSRLAIGTFLAVAAGSALAQPTNTVKATIPLNSGGLCGLGVTKDNKYVYVTGMSSDALFVIDTTTNTAAANPIGLGGYPQFLAISRDGNEVYAANAVSGYTPINTVPGTVSLIVNAQTGTPALQATIPGMGQYAEAIEINPKGTQAWVSNLYGSSVTVIDLKNNIVSPLPIQTGNGPQSIGFTPDGKYAYVTNVFDNTVDQISTASQLITAGPIAVGTGPHDVVVTRDGKKAYVANADGTISVIDTHTNKVSSTIQLNTNNSAFELGCALTPDGKYLYVPNQSAHTVVMVSTKSDMVVGSPVTVGVVPGVVAIAPNGKSAYVTNLYDDTVSVIEITGG